MVFHCLTSAIRGHRKASLGVLLGLSAGDLFSRNCCKLGLIRVLGLLQGALGRRLGCGAFRYCRLLPLIGPILVDGPILSHLGEIWLV